MNIDANKMQTITMGDYMIYNSVNYGTIVLKDDEIYYDKNGSWIHSTDSFIKHATIKDKDDHLLIRYVSSTYLHKALKMDAYIVYQHIYDEINYIRGCIELIQGNDGVYIDGYRVVNYSDTSIGIGWKHMFTLNEKDIVRIYPSTGVWISVRLGSGKNAHCMVHNTEKWIEKSNKKILVGEELLDVLVPYVEFEKLPILM